MAAARHIWITRRQPFMANLLTRIGFIDETSVKTNMARTTGWAPREARLVDHAPFGHSLPGNGLLANRERGNTQTFIAALRHDRLGSLMARSTGTSSTSMSRPGLPKLCNRAT